MLYVCVYVCAGGCVCTCVCMCVRVRVCVLTFVHVCVSSHVCVCVSSWTLWPIKYINRNPSLQYMYVCMYVHARACMHVCMYVCVYVCAPHQRSLTQLPLPVSGRANIYITNKRTKNPNQKLSNMEIFFHYNWPHFVQEDKSMNTFFWEQTFKWWILGSLSLSIDLKRIWIWTIRNKMENMCM